MKAIRVHEHGGPHVLVAEEIETPRPGHGEVLIRVAAVSVTHGDADERRGTAPHPLPLPATLGTEVAGTVIAHGPGVATPLIGTRVIALVSGGYAEYVIASADQVTAIPAGVDFAAATVVPMQGAFAYLTLHEAGRLQRDDRVLIHTTAGGLGWLSLRLARILGAQMVIATSPTGAQLDHLRALGADVAISIQDPQWVERVMALTYGQGVDVIQDGAGGSAAQRSLECLAEFGRMVVFSALRGETLSLESRTLITKCQTITGVNLSLYAPDRTMRARRAVLQFIASGQLPVEISHTFPLAEAAAAHALLERDPTGGKIVLTPPAGDAREEPFG